MKSNGYHFWIPLIISYNILFRKQFNQDNGIGGEDCTVLASKIAGDKETFMRCPLEDCGEGKLLGDDSSVDRGPLIYLLLIYL